LRWEVFTAFLQTFGAFELPIVWAGAERAKTMQHFADSPILSKLHDDQLPHAIAFSYCQTQVELWFRKNAPEEKGICIADPVDRKYMTGFLEDLHRKFRTGVLLTNHLNFKFDHIIEAVSFVHSHKSVGVQLSDACNFLIKRHEAGKADSEPFYKMIEPRIGNKSRLVFPS
jgi:hypothetical protein